MKKGSEDMALAMKQWNTMKVVNGTKLDGDLSGKRLLEYALPEAMSGKVVVWPKTDSVSYFDAYTVTE